MMIWGDVCGERLTLIDEVDTWHDYRPLSHTLWPGIVSTDYYYNNPIFSPLWHLTWHDGRKCSIREWLSVSLSGHRKWSPVSRDVTSNVNTCHSHRGSFFLNFYIKYHNSCCWFCCVVCNPKYKIAVSYIIIHGNNFEGRKWSRNNTIILKIGNSTQLFQSFELLKIQMWVVL